MPSIFTQDSETRGNAAGYVLLEPGRKAVTPESFRNTYSGPAQCNRGKPQPAISEVRESVVRSLLDVVSKMPRHSRSPIDPG